MFKSIKNFVCSVPLPLNILAIFSLAVLFLKVSYLNKIPEWFKNAHELGVIFEGVLASILASYIFYLIVVHLKERRDKAIIYPYVKKWAERVIDECNEQLKLLDKKASKGLSLHKVEEEDLRKAFDNININSNAPIDTFAFPFEQPIEKKLTWIQFFDLHHQETKQYINKCMDQLIHLKTETELVGHLTEIYNCRYF